MIKITRMENQYSKALEKLLLQSGIEDDLSLVYDTMFLVLDGQDVLGFGYYNFYDQDIYLDHLFIKEDERLKKLGDSLFRAILNGIVLKGGKQVYMREDPLYAAFLKAEDLYLEEGKYTIDLYEFFNRKCKGSKEENIH